MQITFRSFICAAILSVAVCLNVRSQNRANDGKDITGQTTINQQSYLVFPFSEYVLRSDWAMPIVWKYKPFKAIIENENVIAPPALNQDWDSWFGQMKLYQSYLRTHLNDTSAMYLEVTPEKGKSVRLNYQRALNPLRLQPHERLIFNGTAQNDHGIAKLTISLMYIRIGRELSHAIERLEKVDAIMITEKLTNLHKEIQIPEFDTQKLMVQPVIFFSTEGAVSSKIDVSNLTLSIPASPFNKKMFIAEKSSFYPPKAAIDTELYHRKEMQWVKNNFISGFAYLWDSDFWDADKKVFTVQKYCDKMKREFNGFQSVLVWYSYPNIGIDERNTWEFLNAIPGGMNALRNMVKTFHDNGVKVYFPYTPWEIDTRKTSNLTDAEHWGKVMKQINADGLFFDTFFDAGDFQQSLDKYKRGVSIGTEHHPSLQNIQGYNAVTASWGQTIVPFDNNGVSRLKWVIPGHIQWKINRNERDRQNSMAYSWINGQGILVWENIFGWMNAWNALDRHTLRKINAIYQLFGGVYTSDSWKPYLPSGQEKVHISSWENKKCRVWNVTADQGNTTDHADIQADARLLEYYDLWTGRKLTVTGGKVRIPLKRFGCVLGLQGAPSPQIIKLMVQQKRENLQKLTGPDEYPNYLSAKKAQLPPAILSAKKNIPLNLITIPAGVYQLSARHFRREGNCYPDSDAKDNDDYKLVKNGFGKELIVHQIKLTLPRLKIMPCVVTNAEFEAFIKEAHYKPADTINFLANWHGTNCPDSLRQKPVAYVSLDDARAYAKWAGMRLPTEWEWQAAGETNKEQFKFNEVWEWNESERYDGHNHFVTLRGGSKTWQLQTSDWYFPGTPNGQKPGGAQPLDSHCKFYIMQAGYDRAGTLGFRCIK